MDVVNFLLLLFSQPGLCRAKDFIDMRIVTQWKGRECRARYSQNWLLRVKSSALVTGFVLAEGTHQTRCLFGEFSNLNDACLAPTNCLLFLSQ